MTRAFNLTPKRIEALRFIQSRPNCYVGAVAQAVLVGPYRQANGRGLWQQQATRAGAGYCQALRDAGLVAINVYTDYGYGTVSLTPAGEATLANIAAAEERQSLDAAINQSNGEPSP